MGSGETLIGMLFPGETPLAVSKSILSQLQPSSAPASHVHDALLPCLCSSAAPLAHRVNHGPWYRYGAACVRGCQPPRTCHPPCHSKIPTEDRNTKRERRSTSTYMGYGGVLHPAGRAQLASLHASSTQPPTVRSSTLCTLLTSARQTTDQARRASASCSKLLY